MPELTTAQWVLIVALGIAQFGLLIAGLVAVLRAPAQRLTAPRVVWAAICFVQFIGPVIFFVAGRKPVPIELPEEAAPQGPIIDRVVTELYGGGRR